MVLGGDGQADLCDAFCLADVTTLGGRTAEPDSFQSDVVRSMTCFRYSYMNASKG